MALAFHHIVLMMPATARLVSDVSGEILFVSFHFFEKFGSSLLRAKLLVICANLGGSE
jgi:hypothetical protein